MCDVEKKWSSKRAKRPQKPKKFKQVKTKDELMNIAVYHLQMRDHSLGEMYKKLIRNVEEYSGNGGGEGLIQQVFETLLDLGYLKSDSDFADNFAERSFSNQYGIKYVRAQLTKKGISQALIEDAIEKALNKNPVDFNQSAKERLEHRYYNGFSDTTKEKVVAQLTKWGFSSSESRYAIESHPMASTLRSKVQVKGSKANVESEVMKLARKLKGMSVISSTLRLKCIDVSELSEIVSKLENSGELNFFENAKERLQKKRYDLSSQKGRTSAYAHLATNGFTSEQIKYAMAELGQTKSC